MEQAKQAKQEAITAEAEAVAVEAQTTMPTVLVVQVVLALYWFGIKKCGQF
jgi:hypothetical protein